MIIKPDAFEAAFNAWIARLRDEAIAETGVERPIISLDGKTARRSHDAKEDLGPDPRRLSRPGAGAWPGAGPAGLRGEVQRDHGDPGIAAEDRRPRRHRDDRRDGGPEGDRRGDHPRRGRLRPGPEAESTRSLHAAVIEHIDERLDGDIGTAQELTTTDRGHGREEERTYLQLPVPEDLPGRGDWKGLKSIGVVTSRRVKGDQESLEVRYYLCSLPVDWTRCSARAVRGQAGRVEGRCHWTLDVTFREDDSRIRDRGARGEHHLAVPLHALRILKQHPDRRASLILEAQGLRLERERFWPHGSH